MFDTENLKVHQYIHKKAKCAEKAINRPCGIATGKLSSPTYIKINLINLSVCPLDQSRFATEGQRPELHAPACPKRSATTRHEAPGDCEGEAQASSRELPLIKAVKALREAPPYYEGGARVRPLGPWRRVRQQVGSAKRELERYARPQPENLGQSCAKRHCAIL
ncbi:MAG: hypothetical protein J3R72DRAFT_498620 [Linnemannia gamsii]|nr:MAG: hypothetical protein J3R72DRAFT_498620 [Linnemannia gamsii]